MDKDKPCRDYEEQGFCVYGETCQFSHGTNPVVLDGVNAGLILTSTVSTTATTGSTTTISTTQHHQPRNNNKNMRSSIKKRLGSSGFSSSRQQRSNNDGSHMHQNHHNNNNNNNNRHHHNNSNTNNGHSSGYKHSGNHAHNHRHSNNNNSIQQQHNIDKCKLEVKRIPQQQNTIKDLNEHFSKFGTIVNIQINHEGDPEGALIQYSSPHEAVAAFRSPEAVFNNRFIRVHWHFKPDLSQPNHESADLQVNHDTKGVKRSYNEIKDEEETTNCTSATDKINSVAEHHHTTNSRHKGQHPSILLQQQQQQQQQINKQGVEIKRKQSDLLTSLIHQQKILIKKIENSTEEKERASLKSILDELTQKTKDLMKKTSLKQGIIRSDQPDVKKDKKNDEST